MSVLNRSINLRGPRFFVDDGRLMFVMHLDASTREGPRAATKDDSLAHPEAWAVFCADVEAQEKGRHVDAPEHPWRPLLEAITADDHEDAGSVADGTAKTSKLQEKRAAAAAAGMKA